MNGRSSLHGAHSAMHASTWHGLLQDRSSCHPRHCIPMPPLCQGGQALPIFQRLRCLPHLSPSGVFAVLKGGGAPAGGDGERDTRIAQHLQRHQLHEWFGEFAGGDDMVQPALNWQLASSTGLMAA
eukprot:1151783-Pelagomonas_calceolata.AAC.2